MTEFTSLEWDNTFGFTPNDDDRNEDDSKIEFEEHQKFVSYSVPSADKLQIEVCDPKKENDKAKANFFISYLVKSRTTLENYENKENQVRHRYTDFINLNNALLSKYPSCIIPPLPEKKVIESFITGDRFSEEFTEKRRNLLEIYMKRIARHPEIQNSDILKNFLENTDMSSIEQARSDNNTVLDGISDSLVNGFSKLKSKKEEFIKAQEKVERLEVNLQHVEKLHNNIIKQERSIGNHMKEFADAAEKFGETDPNLENIINEFSNTLRNVSQNISEKVNKEENVYVGNIKGYINYCQSYKDTLKARDQKQMDYEDLSGRLKSYNDELNKYENNPALISSGITSFVSRKYDEMKGTDPKLRREEKMAKLQKKIEELTPAVEQSSRDTKKFDEDITKEIEYFDKFQIVDFRKYLNDYIDIQMESYQKNKELWDYLIKKFESTTL
jgi:sorting nexin-4